MLYQIEREGKLVNQNASFAISSVVPEFTKLMIQIIHTKIGGKSASKKTFIITHNNCGIKLNVENPETVGTDRLCNIAYTIKHYDVPSIIVDFGTANTYDVIDARGIFIGGAIAPGIETSAQYLIEKAALLENCFIF